MFTLDNPIRTYSWGSQTAMAELFGRSPSGSPEAEMWIGAHPDSPSIAKAEDGTHTGLDELIKENAEAFLGTRHAETFNGRLPFLAKVLAAGRPLSLQVHPNLEQARRGFAAENETGIPQSADHRNYKDANHKPEMIVALSSFEALCGFRSPLAARELFSQLSDRFSASGIAVPKALRTAIGFLDKESHGLRHAFSYLITGGPSVAEAANASAAILAGTPLGVEFSTLVDLQHAYPGDPGVLISLLLNHVSLRPGEALCLPAGNIHAYLRGVGFEVMASSDNVLRGGLTSKYVDVPELMNVADFRTLPVPILKAQEHTHGIKRWHPPFIEFQVEQITAGAGEPAVSLNQNGPLLALVIQGNGRLKTPAGEVTLNAGETIFVPANEHPVTLEANDNTSRPLVAFAVTTGEKI